jgi:hypothetical protein
LGDAILDRLLLLCQEAAAADPPALYHEWVAHPRGVSERWVFQQAVESACAALGDPRFDVTPTQVMAFKNFRFAGSSYFDIGSGLLQFNITPSDDAYLQAQAMLAADRVRADAFDVGADPESGAIAPGEVGWIRNVDGYIPTTWTEARGQLHSMRGLMGALLGHDHPTLVVYCSFLRMYDRMLVMLEREVDAVHGRRLGPSLVTFHIQLVLRIWLATQLDAGETIWVGAPDFHHGLNMMEIQNNLMWLPTITNVRPC